jgi:transposase-like protein
LFYNDFTNHERRLSVDWQRIKAEYIAGGISYRKLAEKYGVSFNTLKTHAVEEQWYKLRQQKDKKTTTKIVESLSDKDAEKAVDIIDVADKLLGKISKIMDEIPLDTQSMKHLTSALKDLKEIKGFKSDADMREQEARIRNLEKQAEADNNNDNEIKVIIEGNLEKYSK